MVLLEKDATTFFEELGEKPILLPQLVASRIVFEVWLWSYPVLWTMLLNH